MRRASSTGHAEGASPLWSSAEKVNSELFSLTYGALVRQLLNDSQDCVEDVNVQLEKLCASAPPLRRPSLTPRRRAAA
jgi:hypothetical protein